MGFTLQGLLLDAIGAPLGAHALLALPTATAPPREGTCTAWPPSGPCSRDEFVLSPEPQGFRPSIPSWGSSFQSVLPFNLALAFIATPPLSPSDGFTFRPARASGYRGVNEWNGPSPDRRLS
jgi:hypothetical protein